jgi:hypothetical protein
MNKYQDPEQQLAVSLLAALASLEHGKLSWIPRVSRSFCLHHRKYNRQHRLQDRHPVQMESCGWTGLDTGSWGNQWKHTMWHTRRGELLLSHFMTTMRLYFQKENPVCVLLEDNVLHSWLCQEAGMHLQPVLPLYSSSVTSCHGLVDRRRIPLHFARLLRAE